MLKGYWVAHRITKRTRKYFQKYTAWYYVQTLQRMIGHHFAGPQASDAADWTTNPTPGRRTPPLAWLPLLPQEIKSAGRKEGGCYLFSLPCSISPTICRLLLHTPSIAQPRREGKFRGKGYTLHDQYCCNQILMFFGCSIFEILEFFMIGEFLWISQRTSAPLGIPYLQFLYRDDSFHSGPTKTLASALGFHQSPYLSRWISW